MHVTKTMTDSHCLRVLVVDDDSAVAETLSLICKYTGHHAAKCYDGEQAMQILESFQPDVLLSDVMMKPVNGIELAIHVRRTLPNCRIMLLSGQAATLNLARDAEAMGFRFEIHKKPVPPQFIVDYLSKCAEEQSDHP